MTDYRLFPSTNGPSAAVPFGGAFLAGVLFKVMQGGCFFTGYWWWVCPSGGQSTAPQKFALWAIKGNGSGVLIPAATVTSETLTAGWNFVPLTTPVPLAIGTAYNACTGFTGPFPDSDTSGGGTGAGDSYGTGGHVFGITQGPLFAYSDQGHPGAEPYGTGQGLFGTAGTDPAANMPLDGSNSANFWMDLQVSDTAPADYAGSYRLWPNKYDGNVVTTTDAPVNYDVATEIALSEPCTLNRIWYYSPSGATQLATRVNVWTITGGGLSGTLAATQSSPSWSGAAGSGWISTPFSGVVLPAGKYKVSAYNGAGTPGLCFATDANTDYMRNGDGKNGITWGPLSMPNLANASAAYNYNGSDPGSTPPFTDGTTLPGQPTFAQGTPDIYPALFAPVPSPTAGSTQNYWVDVEVTPVAPVAVSLADAGTDADSVTLAAALPLADLGTASETAASAAAVALAESGGAAAELTASGGDEPTPAGPRLAPFPDIELLLIGWLQPQFPAARFATELPADITETTVHVTRISGAGRSIRVDRPIVDIDVYAADHPVSVNVALAIEAVIRVARSVVTENGVIQSASTVNGPRWLPEPNPDLRRRSATYEFYVHA